MKKFSLVVSVCLLAALGSGQSWERIVPCYVNNVYYAGAYSGGVNYSRPFWVDIDADGDYDLTIGGESGGMHFYRNVGTASSPSWLFVTEFYENIDIDNRCSQAFVDIDADGDYDLFIGEQDGNVNFFQNVGSPTNDTFVLVTEYYNGINVGSFSAPIFCDIDADGDYDLFIGEHNGNLNFYRNDGTPSAPSWTFVTETWFGIDVGTKNIPWFADIDADGDYDLFIGDAEGMTTFYRNDGTASAPNMVFVTGNYITDVGNTNAPTFVDIDNDGDLDMFIGEYIGNVNFWRNNGTPQTPSWSFVRKYYLEIDVNSSSTPALADLDNDGDLDLIIGEWVGILDYYMNNGTAASHRWTIVSENYDSIDVGDNSRPALADIDDDNDYDLFVGNLIGQIYFYRNTGTPSSAVFTRVDTMYGGIDVGDMCAPAFVDIDADNDFDLFCGSDSGWICFYRNTGTASSPAWTLVSGHYLNINVGTRSNPAFTDVDRDGDQDMFIGAAGGYLYYYRNDGTPSSPSFTLVTASFQNIDVEENAAPVFGDLDADGDPDLLIGERWGGLNYYRQNVDLVPPRPPYIYARKSGSNVYLWWRSVTTDTLGNAENVTHYTVYRSTSPSFVPSAADSIGAAWYPDTFFTNLTAVPAGASYYYLVKAVDVGNNRSRCSNMGFKFNKFYNENAGATSDKNWVSLPWHCNYPVVDDLVDDLSSAGNPLVIVTNLRNDQLYESYVWDQDFGWYGTNFSITPGRGYEMVTVKDTTLYLAGSNNPAGLVALNENAGAASDKNWVSIPYNSAYADVEDITTSYSPAGTPLTVVTSMRNDQLYESYVWDQDFGWYGVNFAIERGRGYEFVATRDTTWNPTEYSNEGGPVILASRPTDKDITSTLGRLAEPDRSPVWIERGHDYVACDAAEYDTPAKRCCREAGISHIVSMHLDLTGYGNLAFTAYRLNDPSDALTEQVIGSGVARKKDLGLIWFNAGNFKKPWKDGEEVLLVIEAIKEGRGHFATLRFILDNRADIQDLTASQGPRLRFRPIPKVKPSGIPGEMEWGPVEDANVIGYSLYAGGKRVNSEIIRGHDYAAIQAVDLRLVFDGGYETSYSSRVAQEKPENTPTAYCISPAAPNPFRDRSAIGYALPANGEVSLCVYDATGRKVRTLVNGYQPAGYYQAGWNGLDDERRPVPTGVYFVRLLTRGYEGQLKVLRVK